MDVDHQQQEQRLAAALQDLVQQIDINDYRDTTGRPARDNQAFLKAQAVVQEFGATHELICKTLDDCGADLVAAARRIWGQRPVPDAIQRDEAQTERQAPCDATFGESAGGQ